MNRLSQKTLLLLVISALLITLLNPEIGLLKLIANPVDDQEQNKPNKNNQPRNARRYAPIDPATIEAYEKIGAILGRFNPEPLEEHGKFLPGSSGDGQYIPMLRLKDRLYGDLRNLPKIQVPFGI